MGLLLLLWALYFHPLLLHPAQTFFAPDSDLVAEHLPAKLFLAREWRETGELPLWNPHHFCGTPFVHDIQVGVFYPPNGVVLVLPESAVGAAVSWVTALHVLAAGVFVLVYARARGLNEPGALVAAVGFMLSSKWMTHLLLAGHTVTAGLAWLPLVLLCAERAIERRSAAFALGAGAALAMLGLGTHPQWTLYAGAFAVAWTAPANRATLPRWAGCWCFAAVVAAGLAAVQLLPTWEASQWSARSGGVESTGALEVGLPTALRLLGPALTYSAPHAWEVQGVFGVYWLAAALAAPAVVGGRARYQSAVLGALVLFALGGAALVEWLPGFDRFRVPTRMLLIAAFPVAYLAGLTTDALTRSAWNLDARLALARGFRRVVLFLGVPAVVGMWFTAGPVWWPFVAYWAAAAVALPLFLRALQNHTASTRTRTGLWLAVLLVDLVAPVATLPAVRPQAELYPSSPILEELRSRPHPVRVLDWDVGDGGRASFLGVGAPQAMAHGGGTPRGYNPLDVRHYREFLAYIVGDDRPVRGNSPYTQQVVPNFEVGEPRLFELLGVTHQAAPAGAPPLPGGWRDVLTDPAPPAVAGGTLPPHTLRAATDPHPRAWVVPRAEPMTGAPLAALRACDFRQTVLVSGDGPLSQPEGAKPGTARVTECRANRVTVELDGAAGWLVLADVWFPGWTCRVDGDAVEVRRANHAFRAVPVPAGAKVAEFRFEPRSLRAGRWVSAVSTALVAVCAAVIGVRAWRCRPGAV